MLTTDKDLMYKRTSTDIVPVWIIRRKLLVRARFDNIDPSRDFKLARSLQMRRICGNKILCTEKRSTIKIISRSKVTGRT